MRTSWVSDTQIFQSTLPVWGATVDQKDERIRDLISIHAPRVGSDAYLLPYKNKGVLISIHAPRVGSDVAKSKLEELMNISIHAPRVGSDVNSPTSTVIAAYFNPRSPCGERQQKHTNKKMNLCLNASDITYFSRKIIRCKGETR